MAIGDGYITIVSEAGFKEIDTRPCCHCGMHFAVIPGSGKLRKHCHQCGGVVCCEKAKCLVHDPAIHPFERRLDLVEAGKLPLHVL